MSHDLYDRVSQQRLTRCTVFRDSETGVPIIKHAQDVVPILDQNKRDANEFAPGPRHMGLRHIARLPNVVVMQLQHMGLLDHKGRPADERALLRFLSEPEHLWLRTDNGRRLA